MEKEFIKDAIISVAGKQAEEVANHMDDKKYINEFLIAKKLGITVNQLRNILYKLSDEGMVSSIRKKDKRKGWYTYFWKIEILKMLDFLKIILEKMIDQINSQIKSREKKNFYICERCNIEFSEENALLQNFTCNECGNIFVMKDNTRLLKELSKNLEKKEKKLKIIEDEIEKEKEKFEKKKIKEMKKENKKKKEKSDKKKEKRKKKTKKKVIKKNAVKKKSSKKPLKKSSKKVKKVKRKKINKKKKAVKTKKKK